MMLDRVRRIGTLVVLSAVLLLAVVQLAFSYAEIGITDDFWSGGLSVAASDFSDIPQSVVNDANRLAAETFGKSGEQYQRFVEQLLINYEEAKGEDFIVFFNPGGWGWKTPDKLKGWGSILEGIQSELDTMGYRSAVVSYRRTGETAASRLRELIEIVNAYPSKAKDLAGRVEFLTTNIPDLKVIVAGESNGTVISDSVMKTLWDNQQVYSIQTGTPFWYNNAVYDRTLVMNNNGTGPDSFNRGDVPTIILASLKSALGIEETPGTVFNFLRAPGHDYSWGYPEIYNQVTRFLEDNFGIKRS